VERKETGRLLEVNNRFGINSFYFHDFMFFPRFWWHVLS
jgi:hypothetical protein